LNEGIDSPGIGGDEERSEGLPGENKKAVVAAMILRDVREPSELATAAIWDRKRSGEQTPVDTSQSSGLSMPSEASATHNFKWCPCPYKQVALGIGMILGTLKSQQI
jgi:hypothetical protein